jgi:hypothetical protein
MPIIAKQAKNQSYYVKMGTAKYGFRAPEEAYKGVEKLLGVVVSKDTDDGIQYGSENKPPRVWVNCANGKSYKRFCDPSKLEALITKGSLNKNKLKGYNVNSVRAVQ